MADKVEYYNGLEIKGSPIELSQHISAISAAGGRFRFVGGEVIEVYGLPEAKDADKKKDAEPKAKPEPAPEPSPEPEIVEAVEEVKVVEPEAAPAPEAPKPARGRKPAAPDAE